MEYLLSQVVHLDKFQTLSPNPRYLVYIQNDGYLIN